MGDLKEEPTPPSIRSQCKGGFSKVAQGRLVLGCQVSKCPERHSWTWVHVRRTVLLPMALSGFHCRKPQISRAVTRSPSGGRRDVISRRIRKVSVGCKNGTSKDIVTIFTGKEDITWYGLIDKFNGHSHLQHWKTENFEREVDTAGGVKGYRFSPPANVFGEVSKNPENDCFCPAGPPCAPNGLFNVSLCQYDSPVLISFPHFYLADPKLRDAVEGISPPEKEKHQLYIDVQPVMGPGLSVKFFGCAHDFHFGDCSVISFSTSKAKSKNLKRAWHCKECCSMNACASAEEDNVDLESVSDSSSSDQWGDPFFRYALTLVCLVLAPPACQTRCLWHLDELVTLQCRAWGHHSPLTQEMVHRILEHSD
uniref:Scavenger receptor class B member 1 n=1 Tax=Timema tahoe TaxID=61484 RepID=A0A7R9IP22_9NEOP|nr:unnamed protein product [Timema tahoe]